jgi:HAD domain in Swiss Army Knife RNA repair proteins
MKIIFLDFTGTIDAIPGEKYSYAPIKTVKKVKPKVVVKAEPKIEVKLAKPSTTSKIINYFRNKYAKPLFPKTTTFANSPSYKKPAPALRPSKRWTGDGFYDNVSPATRYDREGGYGSYEDAYDPHSSYGSSHDYKYEPIDYGPNKTCIKLVEKLAKLTGARIVYSSTRRWDGWKPCADFIGIPKKYSLGHYLPEGNNFGVTPEIEYSFKGGRSLLEEDGIPYQETVEGWTVVNFKERQKEIKMWLDTWKGAKVTNYVILDDDPITIPAMKKHWVAGVRDHGFLTKEYKEALRILGKGK